VSTFAANPERETAARPNPPLARERVLDLGTGLAAPFSAKLLADLGADVLKVERPGTGDPSRTLGPFPGDRFDAEASAAFLYVNTSKRSVTLDLDLPEGQALLGELLQHYDVVIADGPESALAARGLGLSGLRQYNPAVILTTISGFGSAGPYSGYLSTHLITCALAAWANTCGLPDREPLQAGGSVTDLIAGAYGAVATLVAIEGRARNGVGDHVDVSGWESAITAALLPSLTYEYTGALAQRQSNRITGPSFNMACADGFVGVNVLTEPQWKTLCLFVGRPDLAEDPEYSDSRFRFVHAEEIHAMLAPWFAERKAEDVFHEAQAWRLPFGLVVSPQELLTLTPHAERDYFVQQEHPVAGRIVTLGLPFRMSATPSQPSRAPLLGEHNAEVFDALLGLDARRQEQLHSSGVI
jgi:crotonobetainyl-CoA:carnitine CoA-transferase CaiB-like acyl-CoA transferase